MTECLVAKSSDISVECYRRAESSLRVVRTQLDNGQRLIGVRYPQVLISLAEKAAADETRIRQQLVSICLSVCLSVFVCLLVYSFVYLLVCLFIFYSFIYSNSFIHYEIMHTSSADK